MAVTIALPAALRMYADKQAEVAVTGNTAGECIISLADKYPGIKKHLYQDDERLRTFINVYVGDTNIKDLDGLNTPVKDDDVIMLVPAIAGGNGGELSNEEISRYSRHLLLAEIGIEGQKKLKSAKVLIIGTGGLGAPMALYLAAAGIGTIGIVDFDYVDESNLQRQIIHSTKDIARPKVASAKDKLKNINPYINILTHNTMLTSENALDIISGYDIIADGTDNYQTRYLINDACVFLKKPNIYGSVFQFEGQATVFDAQKGPCYRCLYPAPPPPGLVPSCAEGGVMGVLPGIIGTIEANEVIKIIVGGGDNLIGRLLLFDGWRMKFRELKLSKDENCPVCGKNPSITKLIDYEAFCGLKQSDNGIPIETITARELKTKLDNNERIQLIDIREPHERAIVKFPNALIMPLGQIERRVDEFDPEAEAVFLCKIGQRSILGIRALQELGYKGRMFNLKDGLNAWAREVDSTMPIY